MLSFEIYELFKKNYFEEHLLTSASKHYLKRDSNSGASCEFCKLFKNTYFLGSTNGLFWNPSEGVFAQAETELSQGEILSKDAGPFLTFSFRCFSHIFAKLLFLFISNYGQASALEMAYIFKIFWAQSCLIVA